ncbi:SCO family protein [Deminuibacter soli]|uniref:SCO family protein n=1 Tax=Deminuibacter soli TaxID=2291815 RepID=A0A3E1NR23_9BACT|nr:SCO family protein [Deminuibacter soli]RFM30228.1 SCO family protein [Deminuibacter soli]
MRKKLIVYLVFFVALAGGFWYFLFRGTDNWKSKSPVINTVRDFSFTTQDGAPFTQANMQGKVCVVEYFFTTCRGICPRLNTNMHKIYDAFRDEPNFMIVSHTCDPERDSVPVLKHYADSLKVDTKRWVFLTGRKDSLYQAARSSYLLDDPKNSVANINDQFLHTQFFAVVDKNGQVRGQIYDGLKENELKNLQETVKSLLKEKTGESGFANNMFGSTP